ncbi:outer membrane receptor for ferrienterochelin and colicins [Pontibaca methylaminivorans]|uniref:Outer membrane receptor for ferrienterochelin and colicins n=2 Tax=Pontibaca methylaminivorans TaxID=515897 RepID=A0A1R3X0V1_9RHOB|nr:outer membrane receptor for ferrienterochelin and colicins [Pontibaca methylaminivorans]
MSARGVFFSGVSMIALGAVPAGAQETANEPITLDTVVITATQSERSLRDAPASISVIGGEDLEKRPVHDLADALQGMPGVTISSVGGGHRGISIRGMDTDHTLVLIDGARFSNSASAVAHSDYELGWVPAAAIDRIEVVRGPMSSLYGSEALGGVVNIVTRRPGDEWRSAVTLNGAATPRGRGGDQAGLSLHADGPLVPGVLGLSVWAEHRRRAALPSVADPQASSLGEHETSMAGLGLTWTPDDRQRIAFDFGAGYESRWRDVVAASGSYRSDDRIRRNRAVLSHEGEWGWADSRLRLTRSTLERENRRSDGGVPSGPHRLTDTVLDGQVALAPTGAHSLTFGAEIRDERLSDSTVNAVGKASQTHYAAFLQDEIRLAEGLELVLGTRFDRHENFGWEISPRAYLLWHANDALTVRGGVGRGFRAPTLKELSPEYEAIGGGGRFTIIGNPDLEPETSVTMELGADYAGPGWSLGATLFQNDVSNLIETTCILACDLPRGSTRTYNNVNKVRIRGVELGGDLELHRDWMLRAHYTWLDAVDRTDGSRLHGRPRHAATAEVEWWASTNFSATLRLQYTGEQATSTGSGRAPGYMMASLFGDYAVNDRASIRFGVENIGDRRLADDDPAYAMVDPGRRAFLGLTARF